MSLVVWLPLTKDTRNQGLNGISITGSPAAWNNGKLGKCATWNGAVANVLYNNTTDFNYTNNFSVAFWANPVYTGSTAQYAWTVGRADAGGYGYGFQIIDATTARFRFGNGAYSVSAPSNEWHHFVMTVGNNKVTIYKDGSQVSSNNLPGTLPTYSDGNGMGLGCFHHSGNIYPYYGSLNDFRIYDHCLSPMEVKELSKGLVLHYPLNRQGWGQENLLLNTNDLTKWSKESTCTITLENDGYYHIVSTNTNGNRYGIYYDLTFSEVGTYTLSADIRTDWQIGFAASSSFGWPTVTIAGTGNAQHVIKTITTTSENNKCRIYISSQMNSSGVVIKSTYIKNIKVEKGSIATPWCPNSSDELATTIGMNDGIEYDCSGFGNNGTRTGTFSWTSDTPKYSVSQSFNGTDNVITLPSISNILQNSFTMNVWFRKNELGSKSYETLFGGPSGFEMDTRAGGASILTLYMPSPRGGTSYTSFQFGEWYMVTLVNDGTNELYYINGELVKTIEKKAMPNGTYFIGAWNSITSQNYKGLMSDFRVYATALSASDIQSLYQNSAYIDSSGNVYGAVHEEV